MTNSNTLVREDVLQYSANQIRKRVALMRSSEDPALEGMIGRLLVNIDNFERAIAEGDLTDPSIVAELYNNAYDYRETVRAIDNRVVDRVCIQRDIVEMKKSPLNYL